MDQPLSLLRDWQSLVGAVIVAVALAIAVATGLAADGRRRRQEAQALRAAFGAELRQLAGHVLWVQQQVLRLLPPVNPNLASPPRTARDLQSVMRFPEAVVYAHAAGLGALREHAGDIVEFHHRLWRIREGVTTLWSSSSPEYQTVSLASGQLFDVAAALLAALDAALPALVGLAQRYDAAEDAQLNRDLAIAKDQLAELRKRYVNRL